MSAVRSSVCQLCAHHIRGGHQGLSVALTLRPTFYIKPTCFCSGFNWFLIGDRLFWRAAFQTCLSPVILGRGKEEGCGSGFIWMELVGVFLTATSLFQTAARLTSPHITCQTQEWKKQQVFVCVELVSCVSCEFIHLFLQFCVQSHTCMVPLFIMFVGPLI